nr:uncharacterized protein LOC129039973 isoform X9 [Pongo pygmaeus]
MNESELFGWTISVNLAKPMRVKEGSSRPVWSDEDWVEKFAGKRIKRKVVESSQSRKPGENFCYLCTHLKDLASREAASTALSPSSRARAVISQTTAAPGASPSTRRNLMMKTLSSNTQDQVCAGMALSVPWHIWPSWRPQKGRTSTLFYRGRNGHSSSRLGGLLDDSSRLLPSLRAAPGSTSTSVLPRITCLVELPSPDRRCQLHGWFASVPTDSLR